jgi:urease accessory protein
MLSASPRAPEPVGWRGRLSLEFAVQGARTALSRRAHVGPLYAQRPFYPESDGTCHVYVLHPPGGVVGGDELSVELAVGPGARVLATTPAATKLYRCPERGSVVRNQLGVCEGGVLEWLPGETIAFGGARASLLTRVVLEPGAHFLGWEITCLGRPASGDAFSTGRLDQRFELRRGNRPLVLERMLLEAGGALRRGPWGWAGSTVHGVLLATTASSALTSELREHIRPVFEADRFGVTTLGDVTVCRYLGAHAAEARSCLGGAWDIIRRHMLGKPAAAPRVWTT